MCYNRVIEGKANEMQVSGEKLLKLIREDQEEQ